MLQISKPRPAREQDRSVSEFVSPAELYALAIGFVRRRYALVVAAMLVMLVLGVIYIATSPPGFTGHAVLLIDTHKTTPFLQQQSPLGDLPIDSDTVDTQIEILNSENIALSVIRDLHLTQDPEFVSPHVNPFRWLLGFFLGLLEFARSTNSSGEDSPSADLRLERDALDTLQGNLKTKRVGMTYAIEIEFKSLSPKRSAQVANAIADAYVTDALEAKYQTTRRAAAWLQDRLKELREQSTNAERAVVDYKAKNKLVDTGGRLMNEQQLGELNSAIVQARAMTTEAKARLDRVQQILSAGDVDPAASATATVTDTLHNDVITKLRQQYLEQDAKAAVWTKKYGANHLAVVNLRNQMLELRRSIFDELQRIAETYKSDYEIAKAREDSVQQSLNQLVTESQTTNEAQITLHNLESNAQTSRALYDNFLQRYMESVQQQSFPVTEARLITTATTPLHKSTPRTPLIMGLAGVLGMIIGISVGALREISDRALRTKAQIEEQLQADCIAVVPLAKDAVRPAVSRTEEQAEPWVVTRDKSLLWKVVDSPFSPFAESIRAIKVAVDKSKVSRGGRVVGITSSLPNEGKSTIATALAEITAQGGGRTVLVDCDLRNPSLSRKLAPQAEYGLYDIVADNAAAESIVWADTVTGFQFLPAGVRLRIAHSSDLLASNKTKAFFEILRENYDYIIIDLAPLAPVVDVHAMTHLVDGFIFVVEWGQTKVDVVRHALDTARGVYDNLLGVVLNKANVNALRRYESNRAEYYYNRNYARYGYVE
jgi:succinoglycan biosynthesis transport protein ExoP